MSCSFLGLTTLIPYLDARISSDPEIKLTHSNPYRTIEFPFMLSNPVAFHVLLFTGARMYGVLTNDSQLEAYSHVLRSECIQLVNQALENAEDAIKDETIMLVDSLSYEAVSRKPNFLNL